MRGTHGWAEVSRERKREIIDAIVANRPTRGPVHAELDLTDRCNVACYFCNQQDLRTKESIPLPKLTELIDELTQNGLRSVRLSGGGDPLFHRDVVNVMDHLALRGVVIDNLTTNGLALTSEIATRLVEHQAREVIFSLNAVDADDYARMMKVKPALFERILENIRNLIAIRGSAQQPFISVQFLMDRRNAHRAGEMYALGRSLGPDRVAIGTVLEVPLDRVDQAALLDRTDRGMLAPIVEDLLRRDADAGVLDLELSAPGLEDLVRTVRESIGFAPPPHEASAPSFRQENSGCFFAWYTAAITGNGDIRPCCLLLNPNVKPLGNIHDGRTFTEHWTGPRFAKMRDEMREVLLLKGKAAYSRKKFEILEPQCVIDGLCWLKNMYFRVDEEFYAELAQALTQARAEEVRITGNARQRRRAIALFVQERPLLRRSWDWGRERSRPWRKFLKARFGLDVTDAV